MYVRGSVCVYFLYVCIYTRSGTPVAPTDQVAGLYICAYIYKYMCVSVCVYIYICLRICTKRHAYSNLLINWQVYTCVCVYIYIHVRVSVCIYVYRLIYTHEMARP